MVRSDPRAPPEGELLGTEQDQAALFVGVERTGLEAFDAGASDWVVDKGVAEIGHAEGLGDHPAGWVEWMGAENQPRLAGLLEGDAVVHTAR